MSPLVGEESAEYNNGSIRVYVTRKRGGIPQAELDMASIQSKMNRVNLADLESVSRNLQSIVRSLKLPRGQYTVRAKGSGAKSLFSRLKNVEISSLDASKAVAECPSREEIVRAEIEASYSAIEVAHLLHITRQAVQKKRSTQVILGLRVANRFVYPKWQFDRYGQVISGLAAVLKHLFSTEGNSLEVAARLNDRRPFLEGLSIKDCLLAGRVEDAVMAAEGLSSFRV